MADGERFLLGSLDEEEELFGWLADADTVDDFEQELWPVGETTAASRQRRMLSQQVLLALSIGLAYISTMPSMRFSRERLQFEQHMGTLLQESDSAFERYYRMPLHAWLLLRALIDPFLQRDSVMAWVACQRTPIDSTVILHCLLRWLAGGSYQDIKWSAGISVRSFYRAVHAGMAAVCCCMELDYHFPRTTEEVNAAAYAFALLSDNRVVRGCVGAMDGLLVRIQAPRPSETGHVRSFFSGHYHCYGVNVLAVCDHLCRITHLTVARPGGASDVTSFRGSELRNLTDALPDGRFVVADNGFVCTETVITPFSGTDARPWEHESFNYHLSQLRIRIEQAFGFMTTKWSILQKPLKIRLVNVGMLMLTISRLHNYVITHRNRRPHDHDIQPLFYGGQRYNTGYLPTYGRTGRVGTTEMRQAMVTYIEENALARPQRRT
eukprot:GHVU01103302.1.p1 GENE.GHVU01103302.1~~GHVU01103302.1.p1  ORF type:complete len:437 (+),score=23.73 GHVU01103302.1:149-1459(+)